MTETELQIQATDIFLLNGGESFLKVEEFRKYLTGRIEMLTKRLASSPSNLDIEPIQLIAGMISILVINKDIVQQEIKLLYSLLNKINEWEKTVREVIINGRKNGNR